MKKLLLFIPLLLLLVSSCKNDDDITGNPNNDSQLDQQLESAIENASDGNGLSYFTLPTSDDLSAIPQDPKNPLTVNKVELGKLLFHESGMSTNTKKEIGKNTVSCASCHFAQAGFQAGRFQGIGEGGLGFGVNGEGRTKGALYPADLIDVQPIRSSSALNMAYQTNVLWNGQFGATGLNVGTEEEWTEYTPKAVNHLGYEGLETQAIAGIDVHRMECDEDFMAGMSYKSMFDQAFSDFPLEERYSNETAGLAIAAYERTLMSTEAPFQRWLKGENNAMTDQEKRGALLFFGDAGCVSCHTGPALNEMDFKAIGMKDLYELGSEVFNASAESVENKGRGGFTGNPDDNYKFKVPQLYNLEESPFYGHGSSFNSIRDVIDYKNKAVAENSTVPASQLDEEFVPLNLTEDEVTDIAVFIEKALKDPNLNRYVPESVLSGACIPFNDPLAANQLGCD